MLGGEARRLAGGSARRYRMVGKRGEPRWHFVWDGNPHVARPGQSSDGEIGFCSGKRPYMADVKLDRYIFREYTPAPGLLDVSSRPPEFARRCDGAVVFNPSIKIKASPNKQWGFERWREL